MQITVVHLMNLVAYPPVLSLVNCLLDLGHTVNLISYGIDNAPKKILNHSAFHYYEVPQITGDSIIKKFSREKARRKYAQEATEKFMRTSDVLWTTTDISVRSLGDIVLKYKHVMQLMELEEWYPVIVGINMFKFPLDKYARQAWKVVVPEENRAYIQQVWWKLPRVPCVLPNKPYDLDSGELDISTIEAEKRLINEKRKIIMYLGIISDDRKLDVFAKAVERMGEDYCLYALGRIDDTEKEKFEKLQNECKALVYLGNFKAPQHLDLVKYAYAGILPYYTDIHHQFISPLNVLYCAPNKIFEYAGFGIPMIGTNVLGLKGPFEKYNIGRCCKTLLSVDVDEALKNVIEEHDQMSNNCLYFYTSYDLKAIIQGILNDD